MKTSKRRPVGRPAIFVLAILCAFALFASPALASRAMAETATPSPSATTTPTPSPSATTTATPANDKATSTATPTQTASAKATPANSKAASEAAEKVDEAAKADAAKADAAKADAAKADAAKADAAKKKAEADAKASATPEATKVAKAITPPTTGGWTPFSGNAYNDGEISPFYVFINVPANPAGSSISFMVEDSKLSVVSVDAGAWDNDGSGQIGDCSRVGGSNEISCRFYPSDVDRATQASFDAMVRVGVQKLQKVSFSIAGVSESIWISPADQPTTSKPDPVIAYGDWVDVPNGSDCEAGTVGQTRTVTTTDWIARLGEWVKDEPVVTTESQTRPMTVAELADCQPPVDPVDSRVQVGDIKFVQSEVDSGKQAQISGSWSLPDHPVGGPFTFQLALPAELQGVTSSFLMVATDGSGTMGTCAVDGTSLSCAIDQAYVHSHPLGLKGQFDFWVTVTTQVLVPTPTHYNVDGHDVSIVVNPNTVVCENNCDWSGRPNSKTGQYKDGHFVWAVSVAAGPNGMTAGQTVTIQDNLGGNQKFDRQPTLYKSTTLAQLPSGNWWPTDWSLVTPTSVGSDNSSVTFTSEEGAYYYANFFSVPTDGGNQVEYHNSATVTISGNSEGVSASATYYGGNASGVGENVGRFAVTKIVTGNGAGAVDASTTFTGQYVVTSPEGVTSTGRWTFKSGETWTSGDFPKGSSVQLTEIAPTSVGSIEWGKESFSQNDFTMAGGSLTAVTLTNVANLVTPPVNPTPTPTPTPPVTPEPTPEPTPPVTPEPTPEPTPPVTPETTPEPTPPATATPEPSGSPSATPSATATPEPSGSPSATQEPTATSGLNPGVDQGPGADDSPLGSIGVALSIVGLCGILVTAASFFNRRKKA